jgi:hypothetical protein
MTAAVIRQFVPSQRENWGFAHMPGGLRAVGDDRDVRQMPDACRPGRRCPAARLRYRSPRRFPYVGGRVTVWSRRTAPVISYCHGKRQQTGNLHMAKYLVLAATLLGTAACGDTWGQRRHRRWHRRRLGRPDRRPDTTRRPAGCPGGRCGRRRRGRRDDAQALIGSMRPSTFLHGDARPCSWAACR